MYVGRVLYGFGGESLGVANSAILADWFRGRELAFAFGLNLSIARLGSVINNVTSPAIQKSVSIVFSFWFGAILCGVSFLCALCMFPIDKSIEDIIMRNKEQQEGGLLSNGLEAKLLADSSDDVTEGNNGERDVRLVDGLKLPYAFWVLVVACMVVYGCVLPFNNIASSLLLERDYFKSQEDSGCMLYPYPSECQNSTNTPNQFCQSGSFYQPPLPVGQSSSDVDCTEDDPCFEDYCNTRDDSEIQATTIMSIPYIISACLSPFLGKFVDFFGKKQKLDPEFAPTKSS